MTLVNSSPSETGHLAELRLRRYRAGEFSAAESAAAEHHLGSCPPCRAKLRLLVDEQRAFERDIPFERFAGGVERARRVPRQRPRRWWFAGIGGALAAAAVVLFLVRADAPAPSWNTIKGNTVEATLRVATGDAAAQRVVPPGSQEMLEPGARIRLGYRTSEPRYLAAVSVDDAGEVTLVYPQAGPALSVGPTRETVYLPDSLELTGVGREKVFLFLARKPFDSESAREAVRRAHASAKGDLGALPSPTFTGGQQVFSWLFRKP